MYFIWNINREFVLPLTCNTIFSFEDLGLTLSDFKTFLRPCEPPASSALMMYHTNYGRSMTRCALKMLESRHCNLFFTATSWRLSKRKSCYSILILMKRPQILIVICWQVLLKYFGVVWVKPKNCTIDWAFIVRDDWCIISELNLVRFGLLISVSPFGF